MTRSCGSWNECEITLQVTFTKRKKRPYEEGYGAQRALWL